MLRIFTVISWSQGEAAHKLFKTALKGIFPKSNSTIFHSTEQKSAFLIFTTRTEPCVELNEILEEAVTDEQGMYYYLLTENINIKGRVPKNLFGDAALDEVGKHWEQYKDEQKALEKAKVNPVESIEDSIKKEIENNDN